MDRYTVEDQYLCFNVDGRPIKVPLNFVRVLTPVYDMNDTLFFANSKDGKPRYTFDVWIYPTFAESHGIYLRCIEKTGYLYSTLTPTDDINKAHALNAKLSELDGISPTGL